MACNRGLAPRYTETMTIDERLDRLTERHEALTQTVELIAAELQTLRVLAQQDGENIRALVRLAEIHERRLTEIEGGE
jgi:archaellum component FlaC